MYFVKITSVATEANPSFAGETHTYLYGKEETLIETRGSKSLQVEFSPYIAREYGYRRKCDAVRGLKHHHRLNQWAEKEFPYWESVAEVVEINL